MENALRLATSLRTCEEDSSRMVDILNISSALVASIVSIAILRRKKLLQFPDNLLLLLAGASAWMNGTHVLKVVIQENQNSTLCTLQGLSFQFSSMGLIWAWVLLVVVMFQIIVKKISTARIRAYAKVYWGIWIVMVSISSFTRWPLERTRRYLV